MLGVEILVGAGRIGDAGALVDTWIPRLRSSDVPWIKAEAERSVAVLLAARGDVEQALAAADAAMVLAGDAGIPFILARASLTAGEVRRRARQKPPSGPPS